MISRPHRLRQRGTYVSIRKNRMIDLLVILGYITTGIAFLLSMIRYMSTGYRYAKCLRQQYPQLMADPAIRLLGDWALFPIPSLIRAFLKGTLDSRPRNDPLGTLEKANIISAVCAIGAAVVLPASIGLVCWLAG